MTQSPLRGMASLRQRLPALQIRARLKSALRDRFHRPIGLRARGTPSGPDPAMQEALHTAARAWGPVTDWSLHPLALAGLPSLVGDAPLLIVECGSGFSTLALQEWARRRGVPTRIVSFEHQREQISRLREI